ncbi:hypothetical protein ACEQ8H_006125 [Pleosporales sp. CAS-2024a]
MEKQLLAGERRMQKKHNVTTTLNYWDEAGDGLPPTPVVIEKGRITNHRPHLAHEFTVHDVTGDEDEYSLDTTGFQFCRHASREEKFIDETAIESGYYAECIQLLRAITGAPRIHIFNHKVRRGPTQWHHLGFSNLANRGPVTKTHVDQSYAGAALRLRWELPDEAEELLQHRYQIINIWRPIASIARDPLAVADARSVPDADLVEADMTENGFPGKQWVVKYNADHEWYYKHGMTPRDVLLIKCFDSNDKVARRALHTAFEHAEYAGGEPRQSIEVRCLVLYHD